MDKALFTEILHSSSNLPAKLQELVREVIFILLSVGEQREEFWLNLIDKLCGIYLPKSNTLKILSEISSCQFQHYQTLN